MGIAALDVPVVEAEHVRHEAIDGWMEREHQGMMVLRVYRRSGPDDDPENEVFMNLHMSKFAYEAMMRSGPLTCVQKCPGRVKGLKP